MRRHSRLARCVTAWTIVSIGMLASAPIVWGQGERSRTMVTEIWMVGDDLALSRRIPQDLRPYHQSDDEIARSMVNIAESRQRDLDEKTTRWLDQWARDLSDGRIAVDRRAANLGAPATHFQVTTNTQPEPSENEHALPTVLDFDPTELAIEWPIFAFTGAPLPEETQSIDDNSNSPSADSQQVNLDIAATLPVSMPSAPVVEHALVHRQEAMDGAGRAVALAVAKSNHRPADRPHASALLAGRESPTALALSCFAAGVACCFVLHTLLLLTPVRLTMRRPDHDTLCAADDAPMPVTQTDAVVEPARRRSLSSRPPATARAIVAPPDKAGSMVEEFYNSNIELFEKFAQSIP